MFFVAAQCLVEMGEALKQMADVKYSLDDNIKQSFLEPLHHLQTKDLKEVMVSSWFSNVTLLFFSKNGTNLFCKIFKLM